ncbi:calcium-binding protein [Kribbella catacumbae]|uniref:calcium-binding protein n=1 Tax=Kribbella catacumbae TaxID=460086 RepID=UPI00039BEE84|nr:hypothetical protein [Kribbella catacumbae]
MYTSRMAGVVAGALLVSPALVAVSGSPAYAATSATIVNRVLTFTAQPGKVNQLTLDQQASVLIVRDAADTIAPPSGCAALNASAISCPLTSFDTVEVDAGDLGDLVTSDFLGPARLTGGDGNDGLTATGGPVTLLGGQGNDTLRGGPQDDLLDGGPGPDGFYGGGGADTVDYSSRVGRVFVDIDGQVNDDGEVGERDTIMTDVEGVHGGHGVDQLTGNSGPNRLEGGPGGDYLYGGGGNDHLVGTDSADIQKGQPIVDGDDVLHGGDGDDVLAGAAGNDYLEGDAGEDSLHGDKGDDTLYGGPGPSATDTDEDFLDGGPGVNAASYIFRTQGVGIILGCPITKPANSEDCLRDFEFLTGGSGDDLIVAKEHFLRHTLSGGPGNDTLDIKDGRQADLANGGPGDDHCEIDIFTSPSTITREPNASCEHL